MAVKGKELKTKRSDVQTFELDGKQYEIRFDFNVLEELEDVYGDLNIAFEDLLNKKVKAIKRLIYAIVKVDDETVTLKGIGAKLDLDFIEGFAEKLGKTLVESMPEKTKDMGE